jgi:ssDNA-binding Zn-finger/Zn-ribbon topoisomerase 1
MTCAPDEGETEAGEESEVKMQLRDYDADRGCPNCGHRQLLWTGIQPNGDWHGQCPNPDCRVLLRGNVMEDGNLTVTVTPLPSEA